MTIAEMRERSNSLLSRAPQDLLVVLTVLLFSTASFGLGVLYARDSGIGKASDKGFWIEQRATSTVQASPAAVMVAPAASSLVADPVPMASAQIATQPSAGKYVASKTGKKYYLPTCSGAKRIKPENMLWFATSDDAQASGRSPAANCPGL